MERALRRPRENGRMNRLELKGDQMRKLRRFVWLTCALVLAWGPTVSAQSQQKGAGQQNGQAVLVGRLSHTEGQVLRYVYEEKDWVALTKDTPFGAEDSLYSDQDGKAEILIPNNTWVRVGGNTQIQGIALEDDLTEVDVASGMSRFYNRGGKTIVKATTPFGYVVAPADSRFDLYVGDDSVEVIALKGTVDFIHAKNESRYDVVAGAASLIADSREVTAGDGNVDATWDDWNVSRDSLWAKRVEVKGDSYEYLPPQLRDDAYELEENGKWESVQYEGASRNLWRPSNVGPGWSPYSAGRWSDYYGDQCWIPNEPFGYMTHHYGNWIYAGNYWYWAPPIVSVGVAVGPALGLGFGWYPGRVSWLYSDAYVGWVPLAPFEPYYSHRYWGPASFAVASINLPGININIGGLHWLNHGVFVGHNDFYRVGNYHGVRITNINRTTIINNYHASPVINNRVIRNYDTMRDRFRVTDARVLNKPHRSVVERIDRNQRLAERARGERIQGDRVLRDAQGVKQGQLARDAKIERPRLTNKVVPADQVDRPRSELKLQQRELVRQERSQKATDQRLQRQEDKQQRLQDRQDRPRDQRDLKQGGTPGQAEKQIRPERPQRERLDQMRQQRQEQRQQREDTGTQGQQQRLSPQDRRQQQLDERQQQMEQRRQREGTGTQGQQQRLSPQDRRQQQMDERQQQMEQRRQREGTGTQGQQQRLSPQDRRQQQLDERQQQMEQRRQREGTGTQGQQQRLSPQDRRQQQMDERQQGSGAQDRRLQMEERRQQQMQERQQMREQQGGRQMQDRQQQMQDQRQQQQQQQLQQKQQQQQQQQPNQRKKRTPEEQQNPQ
jgi:hypothetical protein